jgi:hypothetical protein
MIYESDIASLNKASNKQPIANGPVSFPSAGTDEIFCSTTEHLLRIIILSLTRAHRSITREGNL